MIAHGQGVWPLKPKVLPQWTGSRAGREGPGHAQNSTTLRLKDCHSQLSVTGCPPEAHPSSASSPHKSSPHFLCGQSNTSSSQPHPLRTIVTSLSDRTGVRCLINCSPLTSCHAPRGTWQGAKVAPNSGPQWHGATPTLHLRTMHTGLWAAKLSISGLFFFFSEGTTH